MDRNRVTLIVEVDLDPVPGLFHTAKSAQETVQSMLDASMPHYNPTVTLKK